MTGEGRFDLIVDGVLRTYRRWEDLPAVFDHVIRFEPDIPPAPHTPEQHAEAALWNSRLQQLMEIERASSNQERGPAWPRRSHIQRFLQLTAGAEQSVNWRAAAQLVPQLG